MTMTQPAATTTLAELLADIVDRYRDMVAAIGRQYRLSTEEREDAAQSTWLQLTRNYQGIRDHDRIGGWLATTMRRECLKLCGRHHREVTLADSPDRADPDSLDVTDTVAQKLAHRRLYEAIGALSTREQRLLMLQLDPREPGYTEIGAALDMPVGSIGPVRGRALRKLRVLLCDLDPVEPSSPIIIGQSRSGTARRGMRRAARPIRPTAPALR